MSPWPATQVSVGDVITNTQLNLLPIRLATSGYLGAPQSTIVFSSIPQVFTHLRLEIRVISTDPGTSATVGFQFNTDAASNYYSEVMKAAAATVSSTETLGSTFGILGSVPAAASLYAGSTTVEIPDYTQLASRHSWTSRYILATAGTTGTLATGLAGGFWDDASGGGHAAAAISTIALVMSPGNFAAGSLATLWGII